MSRSKGVDRILYLLKKYDKYNQKCDLKQRKEVE